MIAFPVYYTYVHACVYVRIFLVTKTFYYRCRDGKRSETRFGMEGICITHSCIPLYTVYMQHIIIISHSGGMQEWVIQMPSTSIPILVSVLFPSLHLRIVTSFWEIFFNAHVHSLSETTPKCTCRACRSAKLQKQMYSLKIIYVYRCRCLMS